MQGTEIKLMSGEYIARHGDDSRDGWNTLNNARNFFLLGCTFARRSLSCPLVRVGAHTAPSYINIRFWSNWNDHGRLYPENGVTPLNVIQDQRDSQGESG